MNRSIKYKMSLDPIKEYIKQVYAVLGKKHDISQAELRNYLIGYLKERKINIPKIYFNGRNRNGDWIKEECLITDYLKYVKTNKKIIVPSFTVYENPEVKESLHPRYISINVKKRSIEKKLSFKAELEGNIDDFIKYDVLQSKRKISNNSLSGAYGTNGTVLTNPSAHYTLTSITRCVSGLGNGLSEVLVGSNRYFRNINDIPNYIASVSANVDIKLVSLVIAKYNLKIVSSSEVVDVLYGCLERYGTNRSIRDYTISLLEELDPYVRTAVLYVNDLWSIKNHNPDFIFNLLTLLGTKSKLKSLDPLKDLEEDIPGVGILTKLIYSEDIKGMMVNYKEMLEKEEYRELVSSMASTCKKITNTFKEYSDFFKAFFLTNILPPNIAYIYNMARDNIVLSDTDSTCCSYDRWVDWYVENANTEVDEIGISGAVMTIVSNLINHGLKILSTNMGVSAENSSYLEMKNEFYWDSFVVSNQTKHYYASTLIREGNVYGSSKREKKGVHFIASNSDKIVVDKINELMDLINNKVSKREQMTLTYLLNEVIGVEKQLIDKFFNKDFSLFSRDSIKEAKAYKLDAEESKYQYHVLWNNLFGDVCGRVPEPPYYIYNIPLTLDTKSSFGEFLENLRETNQGRYLKYVECFGKSGKDNFSVLRLPVEIAKKTGIPEELFPYVNYKKSIKQSCLPLYVLLETVGYFKKGDYLLCELFSNLN